ncbi:MAG: hypothetical protein OHK0017_08460 [Patescibacteria group bacterium]
MPTLTLVLGDQLFEQHPALNTDSDFIMIESKELCNRLNYHKFKLVYILSCLREYRHFLESKKKRVHYFTLDQGLNIEQAIQDIVQKFGYTKLQCATVADKPVRILIKNLASKLNLAYEELTSPAFLTSELEFENYLVESEQSYLMNNFYIWQRKRLENS